MPRTHCLLLPAVVCGLVAAEPAAAQPATGSNAQKPPGLTVKPSDDIGAQAKKAIAQTAASVQGSGTGAGGGGPQQMDRRNTTATALSGIQAKTAKAKMTIDPRK